MINSLISVIVPVYNVDKYLNRCIDSIINQSYKNLEIILVDDGSTDNSGSICDSYKLKDERVIVIHKKNSGQSMARVKGLEIASGDYVAFVDSDDLININTFEIQLNNLLLNDADISICKFIKFNDLDEKKIICLANSLTKVEDYEINCVNNEYALSECLSTKNYTASLWGKLYKKSVFHNINFPQGSEMEDWAVVVDIMLNSKKVVLFDGELYYYYQRDNSTIHSGFKEKDLLLESIFIRNLDLVDKNFPNLHNQAKTNLTANYFYVLDKMIKSQVIDEYKDEFNVILSKLKNDFLFIIFQSKHRIIRKISYIILIVNKELYFKLIKRYH